MDQPRVDIIKKNLYSVFITCILEKLFYTHPLEDSSIVHDHIDVSLIFPLQKDFYITHEHIDAFCLFLFQKDFGTFHVVLFEAFLCFLSNSYC